MTFEDKINNIDISLQLCKIEMNSIYGYCGSNRTSEKWYQLINKLKFEKKNLLLRHERKLKLSKLNEVRLNF